MRSSAGPRIRVAFAAAFAVPAVVLLTTLGVFAALVIPLVATGHATPVALVVGPVLLATWRVVAPRAAAPAALPRRVPAPASIGALAPGEPVWLTADREIVATSDGVLVGGFAAAECTPAALRDGVVCALRDRADTSAARLRRLHTTLVARARLAAGEHPLATLPWGWFARLADAACTVALEARRAPTAWRPDHAAEFDHYWRSYLTPCLEAGYRPPLFAPWRVPDSLLPEDTDGLEAALLGDDALVPLPWERFADAVLIPYARDVAGRASLHGQTVADLAALSADAGGDPERLFALSCALVAALADAGWEIVAVPGDSVRAVSADASLLPFDVPFALAGDRRASWRQFIEAEEIADVRLDPVRPLDPQAIELETLLAAPPAAPPGTRVELPLAGPRSHRVRGALVALVAVGLGVPLVALLLVTPFGLDVPHWGVAFMVGSGVALGAGLAVWARSRIRLARASGRLVIDGERVVVEHPVLLRRPFELPRSSLRAVALDPGPARRDELARRVTLPVAAAPWEGGDALGFLWTDGVGSMVPLLAVEPCLPNVALVFSHRVPAPDVRRQRTRGPLRGAGLGGLLLCATEIPPEAHATLARLGLATELTRHDAIRLQEAVSHR